MAPAKTLTDMARIVRNDYVNAALTVVLMTLVAALVVLGARAALRYYRAPMSLPEAPLASA